MPVNVIQILFHCVIRFPCPINFFVDLYKGPFTNDVSREGREESYPNSDAVREVA